MSLSYTPLWEMLDELKVSKMEFARKIDISNATLAKFGKNEPVTLTVIDKICDAFNCNIDNIVTHTPSPTKENILEAQLTLGTIVMSPCYPLGTTVRTKSANFPPNNCHCLIIKSHTDPYSDEQRYGYLIAPISYKSEPDTILDVPFNHVIIDDKSYNGYIQIGKMGTTFSSSFERIIGKFPKIYIDELNKLLVKLKPILSSYNLCSEVLLDKYFG